MPRHQEGQGVDGEGPDGHRQQGRLLRHKDQGQGPGQQQGRRRQHHAHDGNDAQALPQQPLQLHPLPGAVVIAHDGALPME